jgi:60 kDa SS-A/Ro ribonucleoprotein
MPTTNPLAGVTTLITPQSQPIPGRSGMVANQAGGYVFATGLWQQLEDFLILGVTAGTRRDDGAAGQAAAELVLQAIAEDGPRVVALVEDIATSRPPRAPKPGPYLFAFAAAEAKGGPAARRAVQQVFPDVVRTTQDMATFFGYWKALGGKVTNRGTAPVTGRSARTAMASWLLSAPADDVAFRVCKARSRATPQGEHLAVRDILRIAHPKPGTREQRALFGWVAGKVTGDNARGVLPAVDRFLAAQAVTDPQDAVRVIRERHVPWEFLPSDVLASPEVWAELAATTGLTALIRNLARMTRIGALGLMGGPVADLVAARLTNPAALAQARIHPMDLWLALRVYTSGQSQPDPHRPPQTWIPVPAITDALEAAYGLSFGTFTPSGKRILTVVDSSGSMSWAQVAAGGSVLGSAWEVANTMAIILARTEDAPTINCDTQVHPSPVTPTSNLREISTWTQPGGGGTDMAAPFAWLAAKRIEVDGVVLFTDNETWAGRWHPVQALDAYRSQVAPHARLVVVSMTLTGYSVGDPRDPGVLQLTGLDASLPQVVAGYIRGAA